ncbi:MdtA/MuxA family multidrug efflux RND transporter periplasmic adaptor subunit [Erwinia pyrifoliae]|uniref:Multidrug resistance protein MdtA n=1 Tax=Erwinia pyrifoliae TaxID=79967 RepID=A0ABY5XBG9_ERWPY|nr:MdtA/MuxA family multidrug efflux RND transporter periplasmic adaptor subunit [Erwinia pyrifoliae]UWS34717.1 MdtA/MuxA family multidrug efflux RND transporter periplasmic adaptor subunit [Erwinia pyrifoliae]
MKIPRRFPLIAMTIAAMLAAAALYGWYSHSRASTAQTRQGSEQQRASAQHAGDRPLPVQAAEAVHQSVPQYLSGLGTVTAANTVTLRSRVNGDLVALHFNEGQEVTAGQLLAEIDPRPYEVALMQAEGQLAKDRATLTHARRDLARYEKLAQTQLISAQELDTQRARVSETLGTVKADEGSVASARLNLSYSRVIAPISGRVGLKQVDVGNYVSSGDSNGMVVIAQTHPIDLVFSLPENDIASILSAQKNGQLPVEAWDRSNKKRLTQGVLLSMDNQIDSTTGTVKLKARFDNRDDRLFPNQFVNARLKIGTLQEAIVIPTAALQMSNEGHFVWVINSDNKVSKKTVSPGLQDSEKVVIGDGLEAGEKVVTDGMDRLTDGAQIEVVPPQATPPAGKTALPATGASH